MANGSSGVAPAKSSFTIPKLQLDIIGNQSASISQLNHGHSSADPTSDGFYDWSDPQLNFYARDITPEFLALNPVIVMERYIQHKKKSKRKGWVVSGNGAYNGDQYYGGKSNFNSYGVGVNEVDNFIPLNYLKLGHSSLLLSDYSFPVSRFVSDFTTTALSGIKGAVFAPDWSTRIRFSRHSKKNNRSLKFRFTLAIPNPKWTITNHQNRWIFGEGVTLKVFPRLQTFNDGGGLLDYFISWRYQVKE